jgi:hypothetical protein
VNAAVGRPPGVRWSAFRARVGHWSSRLRVRPIQIRIQVMTRKWASCSPSGRVTFSRDLLKRPIAFQDYVIAHELLHLRIRNHGKLFRATLKAHLPGNPWAVGSPE